MAKTRQTSAGGRYQEGNFSVTKWTKIMVDPTQQNPNIMALIAKALQNYGAQGQGIGQGQGMRQGMGDGTNSLASGAQSLGSAIGKAMGSGGGLGNLANLFAGNPQGFGNPYDPTSGYTNNGMQQLGIVSPAAYGMGSGPV